MVEFKEHAERLTEFVVKSLNFIPNYKRKLLKYFNQRNDLIHDVRSSFWMLKRK